MEQSAVSPRIIPLDGLQTFFLVDNASLAQRPLTNEESSFKLRLRLLREATTSGSLKYCRKEKGRLVIAHADSKDFTDHAHSDWHTDNAHHDVAHVNFTDHHDHA